MREKKCQTDEFKECVLCGKKVHPLQESSAEPLAKGICCVNCAYSRVYPTRMNGGIPSHLSVDKVGQTGKWKTQFVQEKNKQ